MINQVIHEKPGAVKADILALSFFEGMTTLNESQLELDRKLAGGLSGFLSEGIFKGKEGQHEVLHTRSLIDATRILLIGLGKREQLTGEVLRKAAALAMKQADKYKAVTLALPVWGAEQLGAQEAGQCLNEGFMMGKYRFLFYKKKEEEDNGESTVNKIFFLNEEEKVAETLIQGLEEGRIQAEAVMTARTLVNEPPNVLDPEELARRASAVAREAGLSIRVVEKAEMEKLGMGCLLGVTAGSLRPPKLVVLTYEGNADSKEVLGLVGKGLTFDSGGISLKPGAGMDEMKGDMAGAAAVLGAMQAIGRLKLPLNVTAVLGLCENMPSGSAYRPGDILTAMDGTTVEVLNTDAEGRLVLADCLVYIQQLGVTRLIDVATLTGACVIALGQHASGMISNHEVWQHQVAEAGRKAGEICWPLPAFDEYGEQLKSDVADLKNIGGREAGAITAGLFLKAFIKEIPWVHLDIAGTSYTKKPKEYQAKGGTGTAARTLVHVAKNWQPID